MFLCLPREHWNSFTYSLTYLLTELSPSWGAVNCATPQELPSILWNPKVQYRVHKSPPLAPIMSHINPIHSIPSYPSKIHFNIVHPPTSWSSQWSLGNSYTEQMYGFTRLTGEQQYWDSFQILETVSSETGPMLLDPLMFFNIPKSCSDWHCLWRFKILFRKSDIG
jgi:hypothetical protein